MATARADRTAATVPTTPQMMAVAGRPIDRWVQRIFWFPDPADLNPPPLIDVCPGIGVETWPHLGLGGVMNFNAPSKPAQFVYLGRAFGEYLLLAAAPSKGRWLNTHARHWPYLKWCRPLIQTLHDYLKAIAGGP